METEPTKQPDDSTGAANSALAESAGSALRNIRDGLTGIAMSDVDEAASNTASIALDELEQLELVRDSRRLDWLLPRQYSHQTRASVDVELELSAPNDQTQPRAERK